MPAEYNAPDCDYWGSDGAWKEAFDSVEDEQKFQWVAESDTGADDELEDAFPGKLLLLLKDWCNLPLPVNMAFTNHRDFQVKVLSMLIDFWGLIPRILLTCYRGPLPPMHLVCHRLTMLVGSSDHAACMPAKGLKRAKSARMCNAQQEQCCHFGDDSSSILCRHDREGYRGVPGQRSPGAQPAHLLQPALPCPPHRPGVCSA